MKISLTSIEKRILSLEEIRNLGGNGVAVIRAGEPVPEWAGVVIVDNIPEEAIILNTPKR
jgi:hypothetical protein